MCSVPKLTHAGIIDNIITRNVLYFNETIQNNGDLFRQAIRFNEKKCIKLRCFTPNAYT